jgi:DNA-binding transcriptional ArsR family regulator
MAARSTYAVVFAALGDETRLAVLATLSNGEPQSISRLTAGTTLSRQAVTKHLRVLQGAGVVHSVRAGREHLFALETQPLEDVRRYLEAIATQRANGLVRLQSCVEDAASSLRGRSGACA